MQNKQLWAPWRLGYIAAKPASPPAPENLLPGGEAGCFLCRNAVSQDDEADLIVARGPTCQVVLNRYPYNNGHLLIAPLRHEGRLDELTAAESTESQLWIGHFIKIIEGRMNAEGFNVGLNLGRAAGAGVPGHLHWHVVPRWNGDTNFMATLAAVDVIPQALEALWQMLRAESLPEFARTMAR